MSVVTQLYFQIVEEINYMFRPFSGRAIIRLRLEYRRKLVYYNIYTSIELHNEDDATKEVMHCNQGRIYARSKGARAQGGIFPGAAY
jgi:hypothetical protein